MRRLVMVAIGVVLIAAIAWWSTRGDASGRRGGAVEGTGPSSGTGSSGGAARAKASRRMVSAVAPPTETGGAKEGLASRLFRSVCDGTSPVERCRAGQPLGERCDAGDAAACVAMAELFFAPPVQPHFAIVFLRMACKLGDPAACERDRQHRVWWLWPKGQQAGDRPPGEACEAGDLAACGWAVFMPAARREEVNLRWAWKACEGGIADACATVAERSDAATAVRAMDLACRSRSPLHCGYLASMYDDGAVCCQEPRELDDEGEPLACIPCPDFDRTRAEGYAAQVLALTGKPYEPRYEDEPSDREPDEE